MPSCPHRIARDHDKLPFNHDTHFEDGFRDSGCAKNNDHKDVYRKHLLVTNPNIALATTSSLTPFLEAEFYSSDLETMAPYLWMLSQQSSDNVSPLHRQIVKDRRIIITENPRLHLVWTGDRIFIKPIPRYLLSYRFWNDVMVAQECHIWSAALGFLRTYALLIKYESDFAIARRPEARLVPDGIPFEQLSRRLAEIRKFVFDENVSPRYRYGELRLTRLNFYCKFILRRRYYQRVHGQYGSYFAQYYGSILFFLAFVSIFLNAMQVELGIEQVTPGDSSGFLNVCKWFGILTLIAGAVLGLGLLFMLTYMFVAEWSHAIKNRLRRDRIVQSCCRAGEV